LRAKLRAQKPEIGAENPRQVFFGRKSLTKTPSKALLGASS
jgi:hypothetical protein